MPKAGMDSSSDFRIFETNEFRERLEELTPRAAGFIRRKLTEYIYPQLRQEPFYGINIKKLRGYTPDIRRYRLGKYRIFFIVDEGERIVSLLTIDHRKDAYR